MNWKRILPLALLAVMAVVTILIKQRNDKPPEIKPEVNISGDTSFARENQNDEKGTNTEKVKNETSKVRGLQPSRARGLNRHPATINYSKHARCRMDCRHISEQEVKQILLEGKINYKKSELQIRYDCKSKYAVEGYTTDKQHVRIIFAPCSDEVTVVTVIDLGKEWICNCE